MEMMFVSENEEENKKLTVKYLQRTYEYKKEDKAKVKHIKKLIKEKEKSDKKNKRLQKWASNYDSQGIRVISYSILIFLAVMIVGILPQFIKDLSSPDIKNKAFGYRLLIAFGKTIFSFSTLQFIYSSFFITVATLYIPSINRYRKVSRTQKDLYYDSMHIFQRVFFGFKVNREFFKEYQPFFNDHCYLMTCKYFREQEKYVTDFNSKLFKQVKKSVMDQLDLLLNTDIYELFLDNGKDYLKYLHFAKDILSNDEMNEEAFWIMIDLLYTITNMLGSVWERNNEHLSAEIVMELEKDQSEQVASDYFLRMHSLDYIPNKLLEDGFSLK